MENLRKQNAHTKSLVIQQEKELNMSNFIKGQSTKI